MSILEKRAGRRNTTFNLAREHNINSSYIVYVCEIYVEMVAYLYVLAKVI